MRTLRTVCDEFASIHGRNVLTRAEASLIFFPMKFFERDYSVEALLDRLNSIASSDPVLCGQVLERYQLFAISFVILLSLGVLNESNVTYWSIVTQAIIGRISHKLSPG